MFPAAPCFGSIPKLDLGNATKVNAAVGLGVEFEFEAKFEVGVVFFSSEEESVAVVVDNAIADFPVLCDIFEALLFLCSKFF